MDKHNGNAALQHFGSLTKLAAAIGITRQALSYRLREGQPTVTAEEAVRLEEATSGALTRSQLRPDLWPAA